MELSIKSGDMHENRGVKGDKSHPVIEQNHV